MVEIQVWDKGKIPDLVFFSLNLSLGACQFFFTKIPT